ncbi:hypothetical protein HRR78_003611 [Exophiala dermatitidis]|nr:hypothetical protein HRR75_002990 [Exophiala dermatitidis]KAJ4552044.1 hypothetical protein HRR78_003611 [Exophiala dermatitidis]
MDSRPERRVLTPKGRLAAFEAARASRDFPALLAALVLTPPRTSPFHAPYTVAAGSSFPRTPELSWDETPPAAADPPTPEFGLPLHPVDDPLLHSPLAARKVRDTLQTTKHDTSLLDLGTPFYDVKKEELCHASSSGRASRQHIKLGDHGYFQRAEQSNAEADGCTFSRAPAGTNLPGTPEVDPFAACEEKSLDHELPIKSEDEKPETASCAPLAPRPCYGPTNSHNVLLLTSAAPVTTRSPSGTIKPNPVTTITETTPALHAPPITVQPPLAVVWNLTSTLSKILPLEIAERLHTDPLRCIATTLKHQRCSRTNASKLTSDEAASLLDGLSSLQRPLDLCAAAKHTSAVVDQATCRRRHQTPARTYLRELCSYSWNFDATNDANVHGDSAIAHMKTEAEAISRNEGLLPVKQIANPSCTVRITKEGRSNSQSSERLKPVITETSPSQVGNGTTNASLLTPVQTKPSGQFSHVFVKYQWSKKKAALSVPELIRQTLVQPLTQADLARVGCIYMFWHPGDFGYVKIGYSENVEERLRRWRHQCKFDLEQQTTSGDQDFGVDRQIQHPHRIESLIHAELKEYRVSEPRCPNCHKCHREWFNVAEDYAVKVVRKWVQAAEYLYSGRHLNISAAQLEELCKVTEDNRAKLAPLPKKGARSSGKISGSKPGTKAVGKRRGARTNKVPDSDRVVDPPTIVYANQPTDFHFTRRKALTNPAGKWQYQML